MATRAFATSLRTQNFDAATVYKAFDKIARIEYASAGENMVGEELYGPDDLGTEGLHNEAYFYTRLQGQAAKMPDQVRQRFPTASYKTGSIFISGYTQLGIAHEYYPEDLEDNLAGFDFIASMGEDLPILLRDAEEDEYLNLYNNGETIVGGHADTPLFVDGTTHVLQLVGNASFFSGTAASNIIDNAGGMSYALWHLAKQYGRNFVNEEGRSNPVELVQVLGSEQQMDLAEMYWDAPSNIEQGNPDMPNPLSGMRRPTFLRTERLANPNDLILFFEGWQDHIKERSKYRNKADTWEEGHAQFRKVYSQTRSRYGFYFYNNRLVVLVKGAA